MPERLNHLQLDRKNIQIQIIPHIALMRYPKHLFFVLLLQFFYGYEFWLIFRLIASAWPSSTTHRIEIWP